jgi:hypothetical protein
MHHLIANNLDVSEVFLNLFNCGIDPSLIGLLESNLCLGAA